jgi:hypothetical protein
LRLNRKRIMTAKVSFNEKLNRLWYFFPWQLLLLHLKKNHLILAIWFLLFAYATENLSIKYGVPYLFLFPEYLGSVNFLSYFVFGLTIGVFVIVFNIHTYIIYGNRFPFLATLRKPFLKFVINNGIIPSIFVGTYLFSSIRFQLNEELLSKAEVAINISGFLLGQILFVVLSLAYFLSTNTNIFKIANLTDEKGLDLFLGSRQKKMFTQPIKDSGWKVSTYLTGTFKIQLARDASHYDEKILNQVFTQNHINGSLFEFVLVLVFILLGYFSYLDWVKIPAGGSFIILLSILLMIFSAGFTWFKGWTRLIFVALLLGINFLSVKQIFIVRDSRAYGLSYQENKIQDYNKYQREKNNAAWVESKNSNLNRLNNWKNKQNDSKPKLVLVSTSGGGLRAAYWTYSALLEVQKKSENTFFNRTHLITGASGGMLGAAYFRSVYLENISGEPIDALSESKPKIVKDLLNPVLFSLATNDFFLGFRTFDYGGESYFKDRGYAFERQLHNNLDSLFYKPLVYFKSLEQDAEIPSMIISPTIINDGRRLYISPHNLYHLSLGSTDIIDNALINDVVDFKTLFQDNYADSLLFSSALRMSATFPYVLPSVGLPTKPEIEVMDAGIRDNFGLKTTFEYLRANQQWIRENTSGVALLIIRDRNPAAAPINDLNTSLVKKLFDPLNNIYSNLLRTQKYNLDAYFEDIQNLVGVEVNPFILQLDRANLDKNVSLSLHLTKREKLIIDNALKDSTLTKTINEFLGYIK